MVQVGRYRVVNRDTYEELAEASIPDVDVIYIESIEDGVAAVEEVDNKRGSGASNTVQEAILGSLVTDGAIEKT